MRFTVSGFLRFPVGGARDDIVPVFAGARAGVTYDAGMHRVQLLLPLYDNDGQTFPADLFAEVRRELTERFGGLTAYTRAPATGLWKDGEERTVRDDVIVYEVMTPHLDRAWWGEYRERVRVRFRQDALVVRAHAVELL